VICAGARPPVLCAEPGAHHRGIRIGVPARGYRLDQRRRRRVTEAQPAERREWHARDDEPAGAEMPRRFFGRGTRIGERERLAQRGAQARLVDAGERRQHRGTPAIPGAERDAGRGDLGDEARACAATHAATSALCSVSSDTKPVVPNRRKRPSRPKLRQAFLLRRVARVRGGEATDSGR
jgi:hypothetical protein